MLDSVTEQQLLQYRRDGFVTLHTSPLTGPRRGVPDGPDASCRDAGGRALVHRAGPVPHIPHVDINLCTIDPEYLRPERRVAVPLSPGNALIFHSLAHHYTAANRSGLRRRALQFHYHQIGLEWTSPEAHRELYRDRDAEYAGCTVPKGKPFTEASSFLPSPLRPVIPLPA